jgi:serine/threonine protein kinase
MEDKIYNEPNALLQLSHPNIVKYHATYEDTNKIYFVMEFCPSVLFDEKNKIVYNEKDASVIIE